MINSKKFPEILTTRFSKNELVLLLLCQHVLTLYCRLAIDGNVKKNFATLLTTTTSDKNKDNNNNDDSN